MLPNIHCRLLNLTPSLVTGSLKSAIFVPAFIYLFFIRLMRIYLISLVEVFWFAQLSVRFFSLLQRRYLSLRLCDSSSLCLTRLTSLRLKRQTISLWYHRGPITDHICHRLKWSSAESTLFFKRMSPFLFVRHPRRMKTAAEVFLVSFMWSQLVIVGRANFPVFPQTKLYTFCKAQNLSCKRPTNKVFFNQQNSVCS